MDKCQFICGTKPYDGYPTAETYFGRFNAETAVDHDNKDIYYDHLPIYTGGNVYFNGAQPCDAEENYKVDNDNKIELKLKEEDGKYRLETNLYDFLSKFETPFVSTEMLGEAFEPEQKFESPDGTPIVFDQDYLEKNVISCPLQDRLHADVNPGTYYNPSMLPVGLPVFIKQAVPDRRHFSFSCKKFLSSHKALWPPSVIFAYACHGNHCRR